MVYPQVIATFLALFDAIGLPGNLLVIVTIVLGSRFHVMRYILLASLAVSDFLFLILVNSFRIVSIAQKRWPYGEMMCYLNPLFARYFYINTVLHLIAVSYDRYDAIVKSPLTYDGTLTKSKMAFIALIWLIPIPISIGPFMGWGNYVYNPEVFFCQQGWTTQSGSSAWHVMIAIAFLVLPFLVIVILNWSVYKAAKAQANAAAIQRVSVAGSESQRQEMTRQNLIEQKAAVDVSIITGAFLLCFLPGWIEGLCRRSFKSIKVPGNVVLVTSCIFIFSSVSNPIIYSFRKREFRTWIKNQFRPIGLCEGSNDCDIRNDVIAMNSLRFGTNFATEASISALAVQLASQHQDRIWYAGNTGGHRLNLQGSCLSSIPEIDEEQEWAKIIQPTSNGRSAFRL